VIKGLVYCIYAEVGNFARQLASTVAESNLIFKKIKLPRTSNQKLTFL